jgi:hypothetical protein
MFDEKEFFEKIPGGILGISKQKISKHFLN